MKRTLVLLFLAIVICVAIASPQKKIRKRKEARKRSVAPGVVIAGARLTLAILTAVLKQIGDISRKIAIGIDNESGRSWTAKNVYYSSGTSDDILPYSVPHGKALIYTGRKTSHSLHGVVGVLTYKMSDGNTLAVMFHVPFSYLSYDNWWNVKVYNGTKQANDDMYEELYYHGNKLPGNNGWHNRSLGHGLKMRGYMSSSGSAVLDIVVSRAFNTGRKLELNGTLLPYWFVLVMLQREACIWVG